jgi:hypothetical protein
MDSKEKVASDIVSIDLELSKYPDRREEVADRVCEIMATASALDTSKASFSLGMIQEAIRSLRVRNTLLATKKRLLKALNAKSGDAPTDESPSF